MDAGLLRELFLPFESEIQNEKKTPLTKADLYEMGLCGREGSAEKRAEFSRHLGFPADMTAPALLSAVNILYGKEKFAEIYAEFTAK